MLNGQEDMRLAARGQSLAIVRQLAEGEFLGVANLVQGHRVTPDRLRQAVESLGVGLVDPPPWVWNTLDLIPQGDDPADGFRVVVPLWSADGPIPRGLALHIVPTGHDTERVHGLDFVPLEDLPFPPLVEEPEPVRVPRPAGWGPKSDDPVPHRWRPVLLSIIRRLVVGDYSGLVTDGLVLYPDGPDDVSIGRWIEDYPATLVDLPDVAWDYSDYGPEVDSPGVWSVCVDLWTAEEGRSDLTMEAIVWDDGDTITAKVKIVHVM